MQQLVEGAEAAEGKILPAVADAAASGLLPTPAPTQEHRQAYWGGGLTLPKSPAVLGAVWPSPMGWQCTSGASPSICKSDLEAAPAVASKSGAPARTTDAIVKS